MKIFNYILLSFLAVQSLCIAQPKSNFEIVDSLVRISVKEIITNLINDKNYGLKFTGAEEYSIIESKVISYLQEFDFKVLENKENILNYSLDEAKCNYSDVIKDGLFGDFYVQRQIIVTGSYSVDNSDRIGKIIKFKYSNSDNVAYEDVNQIENIAYPFTTSKIPEEPFFSSALEPAIAIGAAAVAVYLFFNIRSK